MREIPRTVRDSKTGEVYRINKMTGKYLMYEVRSGGHLMFSGDEEVIFEWLENFGDGSPKSEAIRLIEDVILYIMNRNQTHPSFERIISELENAIRMLKGERND
jgi:hypothetical protein